MDEKKNMRLHKHIAFIVSLDLRTAATQPECLMGLLYSYVCTRRRPKAAVCMGDQASMTTVFES